jgi:hypothetical protein
MELGWLETNSSVPVNHLASSHWQVTVKSWSATTAQLLCHCRIARRCAELALKPLDLYNTSPNCPQHVQHVL